jgi:hypothetical protein
VPVLFTEAARFQSRLDVEAALAELTIIRAEMPGSSIRGMRIGLYFRRSLISASGHVLPRCPTERAAVVGRDRAPKSRSYTLPNTIVHGLFVLMTRPVSVSIPFAWLILNGTIVSVCCSSLKPSSALAA